MLFNTNTASTAGYALGFVGPAALPILREALTNRHSTVRLAGICGITATPEMARLARREILAARQDVSLSIPVIVLGRLQALLPEEELWPVVVEYLQDSRTVVQIYALRTIAGTHDHAVLAVPLVTPFLSNSNSHVRAQASNTLMTLDPTAAMALGINSNTPVPLILTE